MNGILLINKPAGISSGFLSRWVKKKFNFNKVGHGGTLDPFATGLLVLCINQATKYASAFLASDKEYEGIFRLGLETDSYDITGNIIEEKQAVSMTDLEIISAMKYFVGEIDQEPPMYSAVKHQGKPLYTYARKNKSVERLSRKIMIYNFEFRGRQGNDIHFYLHCSKGTYVRSLCHEVGIQLGTGACVMALNRLRSGELQLKDAIMFENLSDSNISEKPHWIGI